MDLVVLAAAEREILDTQLTLEEIAAGLGDRFSHRVEEALDHLLQFPALGPVFESPYRRMLVPNFPFAVFYSIEGRRVIVQAVLDIRQDPGAIRRRLGLR